MYFAECTVKEEIIMLTFNDIFKSSFLEKVTSFSITDCFISIGISFIIGLFIYAVYKKTFTGVMYSRTFNVSLVAMTMVTALIIQGITSNIILSLGMVGALSIVRFRTAIKDPMDILFLFWSIATGILCGAGLIPLAVIGSVAIGLVLVAMMNHMTLDTAYLLIVKLNGDETEKEVSDLLSSRIKKFFIKSKTITGNQATEIVYEIRLKDQSTSFVNEISNLENIQSAIMLSYDGNYGA